MPPVAEIRYYFEGAWRLARGDEGGMTHFDFSAEGFWRSFWAIVVVAPGYLILVLDQYARRGDTFTLWPALPAEALSYLLGWAVMPIIGIFLTRFYGLASRYVPLIVALNWSTLVQLAVFLVPLALGVLLPTEVTALLLMVATGAVLFYQGFVIKTALGCPVGTALTFLAADLVLVMVINGLLLGGGA